MIKEFKVFFLVKKDLFSFENKRDLNKLAKALNMN